MDRIPAFRGHSNGVGNTPGVHHQGTIHLNSESVGMVDDAFADAFFSQVDEYAPGFSESVVGYDALAPPDLERVFGLTGETHWHVIERERERERGREREKERGRAREGRSPCGPACQVLPTDRALRGPASTFNFCTNCHPHTFPTTKQNNLILKKNKAITSTQHSSDRVTKISTIGSSKTSISVSRSQIYNYATHNFYDLYSHLSHISII
eukprot:sb/3470226/